MSSRGRLPRTRRTALAATLLTAVGGGLVALPQAPAVASITTLCTGYTGCAAKGMGSAGYSAASHTSYWRMYSGHNCTNYAAFRMVKAGVGSARPWTGSGNATNWGAEEKSITNGVPRVGAVAWWRAGAEPAGSAGHVGYVEKVVSANEVIVSMDSWNGDFSWARFTKTGGGWPSGFIHFRDVPLKATASPRVSGFIKVGAALKASAPAFTPAATAVTYQWMQNGVAIPGATGATYVPSNAQLGKALSVRAVGTRYGYPASASTSAATAAVLPGTLRATSNPSLHGVPALGRVLSATAGAWTPTPDAVRFRWLSNGQAIPGATRSTLVATAGTVGRSIAVQVIAQRAGYTDVVKTMSYKAVAPGVMPAVAHPVLVGSPRLGQVLRVRLPQVPKGATESVQWVRAKDGRVVHTGAGAYRVGARDLGSRLVVKLRVSRYGYRTQAVNSRPTALLRTTPTMRVSTARSTKGLASYVSVHAAGITRLGGLVKVVSRGHVVARIPVVNGVGRAYVRRLPHGRSTVRFVYVSNSKIAGTSVVRHVRR